MTDWTSWPIAVNAHLPGVPGKTRCGFDLPALEAALDMTKPRCDRCQAPWRACWGCTHLDRMDSEVASAAVAENGRVVIEPTLLYACTSHGDGLMVNPSFRCERWESREGGDA